MTNRKIQWRPVTLLALAINQPIDLFSFVCFLIHFSFPFRSLISLFRVFYRRRVETTGWHFASTSESNYFLALVGNGSRLPVSRIRKRWTYGSDTKPTYWNSTTWARRQRWGYPDPSWLAFSLLGSQLSDVRGLPGVRLGHFTLTNT